MGEVGSEALTAVVVTLAGLGVIAAVVLLPRAVVRAWSWVRAVAGRAGLVVLVLGAIFAVGLLLPYVAGYPS